MYLLPRGVPDSVRLARLTPVDITARRQRVIEDAGGGESAVVMRARVGDLCYSNSQLGAVLDGNVC